MRIFDTIKKYGLIKKGETIGVAVSGGIDSMALLHWLNAEKNRLGISVTAVNIDHNIRNNSAADSGFVKDFCGRNNIDFKGFSIDVLSRRAASRRTIEEEARNARYEAFDELINSGAVDKVATAHHRSDQAETVLMSIFRGAGAKGASGMDYERSRFIRPLLDTSKTEIKEYVSANNIPYVDDPTNEETEYSRNYLRNVILPEIEKRFTGAADNIVRFAGLTKIDDDYINEKVAALTAEMQAEGNSVRLPLALLAEHDSVVSRILFAAFSSLGIYNNIEFVHIEDIKKLAKSSAAGKYLCLPGGIKVLKDYCSITIQKG